MLGDLGRWNQAGTRETLLGQEEWAEKAVSPPSPSSPGWASFQKEAVATCIPLGMLRSLALNLCAK